MSADNEQTTDQASAALLARYYSSLPTDILKKRLLDAIAEPAAPVYAAVDAQVQPRGVPIDSAERLGGLIRQKRKDQRVTQHELADLAGVSVGTVKALESGANVSLQNILLIGRVLGIGFYAD